MIYPDAHFTLVDGEGNSGRRAGYGPRMEPFNDQAATRQFLEINGMSGRFTMVGPEDAWPGEADVVLSLLSMGYHYPVETYLERIIEHTRPGSLLIFDERKGTNGYGPFKNDFETIHFHSAPHVKGLRKCLRRK